MQEGIADIVAEAAIDIMKPQNVELYEQPDRVCRSVDRRQPVEQAVAVEQASQSIDACCMRDVADQADEMRDMAVVIPEGLQTERIAEHRAVPPIIAERHRTGAPFRQCGADFGDLGLEPVAALEVAAILADRLCGRITGDQFEGRVHLDDRLPSQAHVRDKDTIAGMGKRQQRSGLRGHWLAWPPFPQGPPHRGEGGPCRGYALGFFCFARHGAVMANQPRNPDFCRCSMLGGPSCMSLPPDPKMRPRGRSFNFGGATIQDIPAALSSSVAVPEPAVWNRNRYCSGATPILRRKARLSVVVDPKPAA